MDLKSEITLGDDSIQYMESDEDHGGNLQSLLSSWGMPRLFEKLSSYGIDYEALQFMNESDMDKLFLPLEMGEKIKFRGKLKTWQRDIVSLINKKHTEEFYLFYSNFMQFFVFVC